GEKSTTMSPRFGSLHFAISIVVNGILRSYANLLTTTRSPSSMVGFIEPVGTSFQSARAERSELITRSIARKTRISYQTFFLFISAAGDNSGNHRTIASMPHRTSVHDLKNFILPFPSLIAVETVEEGRVRSLLHEVAVELTLPMFEWSLTDGFLRSAGAAIGETRDPLSALRHIESIAGNE